MGETCRDLVIEVFFIDIGDLLAITKSGSVHQCIHASGDV